VNDTPQQMDWDAVINDALFAVKTSAYLGSMGNMQKFTIRADKKLRL